MKVKELLTREEIIELDKKIKFIPLTFDSMFKSVFTSDLEVLKEFLILETGLSLNPEETEIVLLNNELPKNRDREYKKTIDIFICLNGRINIDVELNNSSFNNYLMVRNELYMSKLYSLMFESGDNKIDFLERKLIQLNLNTEETSINCGEDIILPYGVKTGKFYPQNRESILKYLAYYKNLYYNFGVKLLKSELWLVAILSESLCELYDLLGKLLTDEKRDKFIRKVIEMSEDTFILHEWEKEKMAELKELAIRKDALDEGHDLGYEEGISIGIEQGIEQGISTGLSQGKVEIAKNMLKDNVSIDLISTYTGLTLDEISALKDN